MQLAKNSFGKWIEKKPMKRFVLQKNRVSLEICDLEPLILETQTIEKLSGKSELGNNSN